MTDAIELIEKQQEIIESHGRTIDKLMEAMKIQQNQINVLKRRNLPDNRREA